MDNLRNICTYFRLVSRDTMNRSGEFNLLNPKKPEGKRPLGRPRRRRVENITMDLQEVGCWYMDWIGLAQDRERWRTLVSAVMNLRVPWNAGNFLTCCKPVGFSRRNLHHALSNKAKELLQRTGGGFMARFWNSESAAFPGSFFLMPYMCLFME